MTIDPQRQQIFDPSSGDLLHEIVRPKRTGEPAAGLVRTDFSRPEEFLQGAVIQIPAGHEFRPHVHLERDRRLTNFRAQESWIVISGNVEVDYYTDEGSYICSYVLGAGDITISFRGGHGYRTLGSDALVYEIKSGPYEGVAIDKVFIDKKDD
jgi:mannose-6-phosphate isomerase-like protein (cupin superfamily)